MILLDTSVWVALMNKDDACHTASRSIVEKFNYEDLELFDHIYGEVLTVLRLKTTQENCEKFISYLKYIGIRLNFSSKKSFFLAQELFFAFPKISFIDSLLMAFAKENNAEIITFDKSLQKAWKKIC